MAFKMKTFEQISYSMINWCSSLARGLTDFTVGSRVRTLLESVALEIEEIYWRTYKALTEAQANGVYDSFDFPRESAKKTIGVVTIYKDDILDTTEYFIPAGTLVGTLGTDNIPEIVFEVLLPVSLKVDSILINSFTYDSSTNIYSFSERRVYEIIEVSGTLSGGVPNIFIENTDYQLVEATSTTSAYIEWLTGDKPATGSTFEVEHKSKSVDVQVIAMVPGVSGNASATRVNVMRTIINGIDGVTNYESFISGADEETDDERKTRFTQFINGFYRGTIEAIKYAIFNKTSVYTIASATILENQPVPGFIKIYVADNTGEASTEIIADVTQAVENYRGAGIVVTVASATRVEIDVECQLTVKSGYTKEVIGANVENALFDHLSRYRLPKRIDSDTLEIMEEDGNTIMHLSNLDYVVMSTRLDAIVEADISFKRSADNTSYSNWDGGINGPDTPLNPKIIDDIVPVVNEGVAEIFRPGNINVTYKL